MTECLCAYRPSFDWDGNDIDVIYCYNSQCPVEHTEEELKYARNINQPKRPSDGPAWKVWYGA